MSIAPVRKSVHGCGRAELHAFGKHAVFSELSFTYPLKLMSPTIASDAERCVGIAYILSYGGGLISSDRIEVSFNVGPSAILMLLTQVTSFPLDSVARESYRHPRVRRRSSALEPRIALEQATPAARRSLAAKISRHNHLLQQWLPVLACYCSRTP